MIMTTEEEVLACIRAGWKLAFVMPGSPFLRKSECGFIKVADDIANQLVLENKVVLRSCQHGMALYTMPNKSSIAHDPV